MLKSQLSKKSATGIGIDNFGHGIWHLSHVHYTGHYLPKKRTAYPALLLIVLLVGVFLLTWSKIVSASTGGNGSYSVVASVIAPTIKTPATIIYPQDNAVFSHSNITVSGLCYFPSYVDVSKNGIFAGSALCSQTGSWALNMTLLPGVNQLQASIFNLTNLAGPVSAVTSVVFQSNTVNPLIIKSNINYLGVTYNKSVSLYLDVEGGNAPYAINVNWGDGSSNLISRLNNGPFNFSHTYIKPSSTHDSYKIVVTTTDYKGNQTVLQLLAVTNENSPFNLVANTSNSSSTGLGVLSKITKYIWPSYAVVILMLISFWLGERQEHFNLKSHR